MKYKAKKVKLKYRINKKRIAEVCELLDLLKLQIKTATKSCTGIDTDDFINELRGR